MVTTRQKKAVTYKDGNDAEDDDMSVDGHASVSDEDGEYGKPARKKRRPSRGKGKARALLKGFFDALPLDIIFEIFGHLEPLDLLQLARTSKVLRSHLMSKASVSIWRTARLNASPEVPDCPPDQSEPQWANLLFIPECNLCGAKKIQKIDWYFRFRGCDKCFKNEIVYEKHAPKRYPDVDDITTVLQVLPYSNIGGWAHGHKTSGKFYFAPAIEAMSEVVENYQTRIDAGIKGAQEEMDKFIAEKKEEIEAIREHADTCLEWEEETRQEKNDLRAELRAARKNAINKRLAALGHDQRDINRIQWARIFDSTAEVTDRVWERSLKAMLEVYINSAKEERLDDERRAIVDRRKAEARKTWQEFKNTTQISTFCPSIEELLRMDPFASIIDRPTEVTVTKADFDAVALSLPEVIIDWQTRKKPEILRTVGKPDEDPAILDLAVTCLICSNSTGYGNTRNPITIFHVDEWLGNHEHYSPRGSHRNSESEPWACLQFNARTSEVVRGFVEALGLDPASATPKDMDAIDPRFYCTLCSDGDEYLAWTWRGLTRHFRIDHSDLDPKYTRLSDDDAEAIKSIELRNVRDPALRFRPSDGSSRTLMTLRGAVDYASERQREFNVTDYLINPTWPPKPVSLTDVFAPLSPVPQPGAIDADDFGTQSQKDPIWGGGSDLSSENSFIEEEAE